MTATKETKTVTKATTKPAVKTKVSPEQQALLDIKAILKNGVNSAVRRGHFDAVLEANKVVLPEEK